MSLLVTAERHVNQIRENYIVDETIRGARKLLSDRATAVSVLVLLFIIFLGLFGQAITPYEYDERQYDADGELKQFEPPSTDHWLGTTRTGYDVFSRLIYGAQPTLITGFLGGLIIVGIGLSIGVTAGYLGGAVDEVLMRFTDFVYSVPVIPTAIVLVAYFGMGFWTTILLIGAILWRGNARVFRSQVLQIREREYVKTAEALGANNRHIAIKHLIPNMGGMIVLFLALGIGTTILVAAGLAFLGLTSPFVPTWGIMLRNAYSSGAFTQAWWWTYPPGILISVTVLATFMIGRGYERAFEMDQVEDDR